MAMRSYAHTKDRIETADKLSSEEVAALPFVDVYESIIKESIGR